MEIFIIYCYSHRHLFEREPFGPSHCMRMYFLRDFYQAIYYEENVDNNKVQCCSSSFNLSVKQTMVTGIYPIVCNVSYFFVFHMAF